jgi:hypothetical protein
MLAYYEEGILTVTSYFADGAYCKNCGLTITGADGAELYKGTLGADAEAVLEQGFPMPFTVTVDAGMGHKAVYTVTQDEAEAQNAPDARPVQEHSHAESVDMNELKQFIKKELTAQKMEILASVETNRSNTDRIIAGIGYILGIFGLLVLLRRR